MVDYPSDSLASCFCKGPTVFLF